MATTTTNFDQPDDDERHELFVSLLTAAHRRLLAYLLPLLRNRHDAEDVLQRASLTMWRRFDSFETGSDFLAWASTVAFYEAKNFQRVAARSRLRFHDELLQTLAEERLVELDRSDKRREALQGCLQMLDEPQQQLIAAAYGESSDLMGLAQQLGRAPQTIYNKLNVIRRMLLDCVTRRLAEDAS